MKHAPPNERSYVLLVAGETKPIAIDLSSAYSIGEPGDYEISLSLHLQAFESAVLPPPPAKPEWITIASDTENIRILPGSGGLHTEGERARAASQVLSGPTEKTLSPAPGVPVPIVLNANATQTAAVMSAHEWAYYSVLACLGAIGQDVYDTWFGTGNATVVDNKYQTIAQGMSQKQITYNLQDVHSECSFGTIAYTYKNSTTVYLCSLFFTFFGTWQTSPEDQSQTVVHELSHAIASTDDYVYGEWACEELAVSNPDEAIDNADNYGYCALEIAPGPIPRNNGIWVSETELPDTTTARVTAASASSAEIVMMYQDANVDNSWIWFKALNANNWQQGSSHTIENPYNGDKCKTLYAPALAAANNSYYAVYVNGDPKSANYGILLYTIGNGSEPAWINPMPCGRGVNGAAMSPALAYFKGLLYCVYVDQNQNLNVLTGTPAGDVAVQWNFPVPIGSGYQSSVEPGLGIFEGSLYCFYSRNDAALRYTSTSNGTEWTAEQYLSENQSSNGIGVAPMKEGPHSRLLCLYQGPLNDHNLRYCSFDGTDWTADYRESSNLTSAGPALVACGPSLHAFYRGGDNRNIYWASTAFQSNVSSIAELPEEQRVEITA